MAFRLGTLVQGAQLLTPLAQRASEMWKQSQEERPAQGELTLADLDARVEDLEDQIEQRDELDRQTVEQIERHARLIAESSRRASISFVAALAAVALGFISLTVAVLALVLS